MPENGLAAALVKFQGSGFAVPRTRTVEVESKKTGSKYSFSYAPHELIIAAIRKPLEDCGLAVSQPLGAMSDGRPALLTILLHTSGERIEAMFPLPINDGMTAQELGSAITYIRRYALSAILGLATEDDDDGNRASGNKVTDRTDRPNPRPAPEHLPPREGSLIGIAEVGGQEYDWEQRPTPDGPAVGFKLTEGRQQVRVIAYGQLALELQAFREAIEGKRVTCYGTMSNEHWTVNKGTPNEREVPYTRLLCSRITGPDGLDLPMPDIAAPSLPLFSEDEERAIEAALP